MNIFCSSPNCINKPIYKFSNKSYCEICIRKIGKEEIAFILLEIWEGSDKNCIFKIGDFKCAKNKIAGYPGEKALYCEIHALEGMVRYPSAKCRYKDCDKPATYTIYVGNNQCNPFGRMCEQHREPKSISIVRKKCKCGKCGETIGIVNELGIRRRCMNKLSN